MICNGLSYPSLHHLPLYHLSTTEEEITQIDQYMHDHHHHHHHHHRNNVVEAKRNDANNDECKIGDVDGLSVAETRSVYDSVGRKNKMPSNQHKESAISRDQDKRTLLILLLLFFF